MEIVFTNHAIYRLKKRKILEQEVIDTIKCPDVTIKRYGLYYFRKNLSRGIIEVSCEKTEKIEKDKSYWTKISLLSFYFRKRIDQKLLSLSKIIKIVTIYWL